MEFANSAYTVLEKKRDDTGYVEFLETYPFDEIRYTVVICFNVTKATTKTYARTFKYKKAAEKFFGKSNSTDISGQRCFYAHKYPDCKVQRVNMVE